VSGNIEKRPGCVEFRELTVATIMLLMERGQRSEEAGERARKAAKGGALSEHFAAIRELYEINQDAIARGEYDPYIVDWTLFFTPIETDAWYAIRYYGVPFYPQYPVDRYFLDFGDPVRKIGLELDGKQWHDKAKDAARDDVLWNLGWRIFRVTGREAHVILPSPADLRERGVSDSELEFRTRQWVFDSVDGVVAALANFYYRGRPEAFDGLVQTLDRHRLAPFPLSPLCDEQV
jgi:hypothetical protein